MTDIEMGIGAEALWTQIRTAIKEQVLADFIADFTPGATKQCDLLEGWILNVDGASNNMGQEMELSLPLQKDLSSSGPLFSASQPPTMNPSMRQC